MDVLTDLSLVSHVRGTNYDPTTSGGGGSSANPLPPGGVDRKGDREESYRQKSADHFVRRLNGLVRRLPQISDPDAESARDDILAGAREALKSWRQTPQVAGHDPEAGTRAWKIRVANDPRSSRMVAGHYGVSHVTVLRYREQYAGVAE